MHSLVGSWRLIRKGSDYLPGLNSLDGIPIIANVNSVSDTEYFKIVKNKQYDTDEIILYHITNNTTIVCQQSYQLCTLNFECINSNGIILGIVQNCNDNFTELCISRMGPNQGQSSRELYILNPKTDEIQLVIEILSGDGSHLTLIKYFERYDDFKDSNDVALTSCNRSMGWQLYDYWSSTILSEASALIVKAIKVKTQHRMAGSNQATKARIMETIWTREAFHDDFYIDLNSMPRHIGTKSTEGDECIAYVIQVTLDDNTWYVVHRYSEFEILRNFFLLQAPYNNQYKEAANEFPSKALGVMFRRTSVVMTRVTGLGNFLNFFLKYAKYGRQNVIDALCSFLAIPENLSNTHRPDQLRRQRTLPPPALVNRVTNPNEKIFSSALAAAAAAHPPHEPPTPTIVPRIDNYDMHSAETKSVSPISSPTDNRNVNNTTTTATITANNTNNIPNNESKGTPRPQSTPVTTTPTLNYQNEMIPGPFSTEKLTTLLKSGMKIIKHGRSGYPKERILHCDKAGSVIHWHDGQLSDTTKQIILSDVKHIRLGTEVDVEETPKHLLDHFHLLGGGRTSLPIDISHDNDSVAESSVAESDTNKPRRKLGKRKASISLKFGGKSAEDRVLYGTSNLRRHCKANAMHLCFSLLLSDRTVDIQCLNDKDYVLLLEAIGAACGLQKRQRK